MGLFVTLFFLNIVLLTELYIYLFQMKYNMLPVFLNTYIRNNWDVHDFCFA